jgi:putative inorganic carbon (HCO3(-)) transporter
MQLSADSRTWALPAGLLTLGLAIGVLSGVDPRLGLAAAMSLGFVTVVLADLAVGLCLYALIAFLNIVPDLGSSFLSFDKVAGGLLALSWLAAVASRKGARRAFVTAHPLFAAVLVFFLAWTTLSLTWAGSISDGVQSVTRYILSAFLFLIVFTAIRTRRHVEWLVGAFVVASLLSAAYGFVTPPDPSLGESDRLAGTLGDSNALAAVLVAGVVLSLALAFELKRKPLIRIGLLVIAALCLLSNFLTLSRGGLIALGVAMLAAIAFGGRWRTAAVGLAVLVAASVFVFFSFIATADQTARVTSFGGGGSGRTDLWTVGWRMVQAHPVRGIGAGNFQPESIHYLIAPGALFRTDLILNTQHVAHNTYLQVLSELGVVALVPFLAILGFAMWCLLAAARGFKARDEEGMEMIARATLVGLTGILAADFFVSGQFSKQLWLLLGLGPALLAMSRRPSVDEADDDPGADVTAPLAPEHLEPGPALLEPRPVPT